MDMNFDELRVKAEQLLAGDEETLDKADVAALLDDLKTYQTELQHQNEELRRAHAEIDLLHQQYMDLYLLAPVGYLIVDAHGQIVDLNLTASRMLQRERRYATGKWLTDFIATETLSDFHELLDDTLRTEMAQTANLILRNHFSEREMVHVRVIGQAYHHNDKQLVRLTLTDITELRNVEAQLQESERNYRDLFENAQDVIFTINLKRELTSINQVGERVLGYTRDEIIGKNLDALTEMLDIDRDVIQRNRENVTPDPIDQRLPPYEIMVTNAAGEVIPLEVTSRLMYENGKPVGIQGIARDITERKETERETREAYRFAQNTVDSLSESLAIVDNEGTIIAVNEAWNRFALDNGGNLEAVGVGVNYFNVCAAAVATEFEASATEFAQALRAVLAGELDSYSQEYQMSDGWYKGGIVPFTDMTSPRAVITHENITAYKEMEFAIRQHGRREAILRDIAVAINDMNDVEEGVQYTIDRVCDVLNCEVGHAYLKSQDDEKVFPSSVWYLRDQEQFAPFRDMTEALAIPVTSSTFVKPVIDGEITTIRELGQHDGFLRADAAEQSGLKTGFAVPVIIQQEVIAFLEFFTTRLITLDEDDLAFLKLTGALLGQVVERKQARKALSESEERFRTLIQNSTDILSVFDTDLVGKYHSQAMERIMGYSVPEILGIDIYRVVHPDDRHILERVHKRLLEAPDEDQMLEIRLRDANGDWRWIEAVMSNQTDNPIIRGILVTSRDVTDRKLTEAESRQLNEDLEQRNRDLVYIYEVGQLLAGTLDLKQIYRALHQGLAQNLLDSPHFVVASFDNETEMIRCQFAIVDGDEQPAHEFPEMPLGDGPTSEAIRTKEIQVVDLQETRRKLAPQGRSHLVGDEKLPMSGLYLPIISAEKVRGVMSFQSYQVGAYDEINQAVLSTIATQAAVALENALLYQEVQQHAGTLEQRVAERTRQLERLNKRITAILDNVPEPILLITEHGTIELGNPGFKQVFGYEISEVSDEPLSIIADAAHQGVLLDAVNRVRTSGQAQRVQIECRRKDGSKFDADLSLASIPHNENHLVCTVFDISEFKAIERMKDQFISTVNHELRTPVTGMILGAETLDRYYHRLNETQRLAKISQIQQQGKSMMELIDAILDLARFESRKHTPGTASVDMVRLLDQVVQELRPNAENREQSLVVSREVDELACGGDYTDFSRVWRNLISNAIKYTPDEGRIDVRLMVEKAGTSDILPADVSEGRYVVGQVQDNGRGIAHEDIKHLFTRFYRGQASASGISGTGLGLSLVREILVLYGGDIRVESKIGEGSTFTFWLPL